MKASDFNFLEKLLLTPSPSGFEQDIQEIVRKSVKGVADEVKTDVHGNVICSLNPKAPIQIMLAGHCDQIGFMVHHIDSAGYLYFKAIGGIDPSVVPGTHLVILTDKGELPAVVGYKPVHLVPRSDRGKKLELKHFWLDIGAKNEKEARNLVSVGDPVVYRPMVSRLGKSQISGPGLDDRVGVYVVLQAFRKVAKAIKGKKSFPVGLHAVSTVQEEIGLRGARTSCFGLSPDAGIAVDVTHATDNPGANSKEVGDIKLGSGPTIARGANINPVLEGMLRKTAKAKKIPVQLLAAPNATGTDANAMQISGAGVATALLGLPNRYMHTQVECCDLRDFDYCADLIAETVLKVTSKTSFIPKKR